MLSKIIKILQPNFFELGLCVSKEDKWYYIYGINMFIDAFIF